MLAFMEPVRMAVVSHAVTAQNWLAALPIPAQTDTTVPPTAAPNANEQLQKGISDATKTWNELFPGVDTSFLPFRDNFRNIIGIITILGVAIMIILILISWFSFGKAGSDEEGKKKALSSLKIRGSVLAGVFFTGLILLLIGTLAKSS